MESLIETVKCNECKLFLQSHVVLPCGNSICKNHVVGIKSYNCCRCDHEHVVPDNGYIANNGLNSVIDVSFPDFKRAVNACDLYKSTIAELESIKNEPTSVIENKIGELKAQVRSYCDDLIKEINCKRELIVLDLDKFELECKEKCENSMDHVENRLVKEKLRLESLSMDMSASIQTNWKSIFEQCELETEKLVNFTTSIKRSLLLYRLDEFNQKLNEFRQNKLVNFAERPNAGANNVREGNVGDVLSSDIQECSKMKVEVNNGFQGEKDDSGEDDDDDDLENTEDSINHDIDETHSSTNKNQAARRLEKSQIEKVFNGGIQSPKHFAMRLFNKYFSKKERLFGSIFGKANLQPLDPVRIDFIKSHVTSRFGDHLSNRKWRECLCYITKNRMAYMHRKVNFRKEINTSL